MNNDAGCKLPEPPVPRSIQQSESIPVPSRPSYSARHFFDFVHYDPSDDDDLFTNSTELADDNEESNDYFNDVVVYRRSCKRPRTLLRSVPTRLDFAIRHVDLIKLRHHEQYNFKIRNPMKARIIIAPPTEEWCEGFEMWENLPKINSDM